MFKQAKQDFEKWLRAIVADEVEKINRDFNRERGALLCTIRASNDAAQANAAQVNAAVDRLTELSHIKEATELRQTIRVLEAGIVEVSDKFRKLHPPELVKK